jgi:hypothetical protein
MAVFGTELFVFKKTKFFVFYGNSTDATGGVVFNYRMVDTGVGCAAAGAKLTATHETGVYFVARDGVYVTTGGAPVKVSGAIDPMFSATNLPIPAPFSSVIAAPLASFTHLDIARGSLYMFGATAGLLAFYTFVYDLVARRWMVFDWGVRSVLDGADVDNQGSLVLGLFPSGKIALSDTSDTSDAGAAISWHHQSGFYDLGSQHSKRTRQTVAWGSGSPTVSVFTDHGSTDANAAAVTLGTAPAVARGWHRKAYRGVLFSHKLSGSTAATVHRIGHTVADERVAQ